MRKEILVITSSFKLYYKINQVLGGRYRIVHALKMNGKVNAFPFIISTPKERSRIPHHNVLALHPNQSEISIKSRIMNKIQQTPPITLSVGIDPGHTIGIAILQNSEIISTNAVFSIDNLLIWLKNQLNQIVYTHVYLKVGHGDPLIRDEILLRLNREGFHPIYIINEHNTSVRLFQDRTRHESAAILIAKREGRLY